MIQSIPSSQQLHRVFSTEDALLNYLNTPNISPDELRRRLADALKGDPKWQRIVLILNKKVDFLTVSLANEALEQAAIHGNIDCLKLVLQSGMSNHKSVALKLTASKNRLACLQILIEESIPDNEVISALVESAQRGHLECLRHILANRFLPPSAIGSSLECAAMKGQRQCIEALLEADPQPVYIEQALEHAALNGKADCIPLLLAKNPRVAFVEGVLRSVPREFPASILALQTWLDEKKKAEPPPSGSGLCSFL